LTVVYVTHDQGEALAVSDQIIVMNRGRIAQCGTARQVYERPTDAFVAGFMGEALILEGVRDGHGRIRVGDLLIDSPMALGLSHRGQNQQEDALKQSRDEVADSAAGEGPVRIAVRPQAWQVSDVPLGHGADPASANGLPGVVTHYAWLGSSAELTVKTAIGQVFVVNHEVDRDWHAGDAVVLRLGRQGIALLPA
jgi:iron(III) transport system ATP-binding protein